MRESDGLEPGMHAERAEDVANVVADGLDAQIQLTGDVVRPPAVLEQTEHLGLAWGQMGVSGPWRCVVDVCDLTEDAHHSIALDQRHAAQLDADALAVRTDHHDLGVMRLRWAGDVPGKGLPRPAGLFGRDDRGELPPPNVAHQPPSGGAQPTDDLVGSTT